MGVHSPLLPDLRPSPEPGASASGAVFNLSTTIVGAGIMSIPATMRVLGLLPAFILIAAVAALSDASAEFLLRYAAGAGVSYSTVMGESFGRTLGPAALQICVALTNGGALVMYLIIIGDVMAGSRADGYDHAGLLKDWFGEHWWTERAAAIGIVLAGVMLPLGLLRRVDSLRFTSAVSILLAVVFVFISSGMALYALFNGKTKSPRLLPDFTQLSSFFELFTAVPVIVVAFTFHFNGGCLSCWPCGFHLFKCLPHVFFPIMKNLWKYFIPMQNLILFMIALYQKSLSKVNSMNELLRSNGSRLSHVLRHNCKHI